MAEETKYVVQRKTGDGLWEDLASVLVPPRTKRKTILEKALLDSDDALEAGVYRVMDGESMRPLIVSLEEQPPRLKIG
jgi:hypothetical protein